MSFTPRRVNFQMRTREGNKKNKNRKNLNICTVILLCPTLTHTHTHLRKKQNKRRCKDGKIRRKKNCKQIGFDGQKKKDE